MDVNPSPPDGDEEAGSEEAGSEASSARDGHLEAQFPNPCAPSAHQHPPIKNHRLLAGVSQVVFIKGRTCEDFFNRLMLPPGQCDTDRHGRHVAL
jgi:hypothetical protein